MIARTLFLSAPEANLSRRTATVLGYLRSLNQSPAAWSCQQPTRRLLLYKLQDLRCAYSHCSEAQC